MNNRFLKIISFILVAASFIFIIKALTGLNINKIGAILIPSRLILLLIMSLIYSFNTVFFAFAWKKLLFIFSGQEIPSRVIINLYLKSNIAKYLPGNVFHFAGRHLLVKEKKISHTHLLLSNLAEIFLLILSSILIVLTGLVMGLIAIPRQVISLISFKYIISGFIVLSIISLLVIIILIRKKQYSSIMKIVKIINIKNLKEICLSMLLYSTMFIISGFILYYILDMLAFESFSIYLLYRLIFVFTLSWVLGYIVPGAPGGVGIREAVIILMLSPILDSQTAALGSLILRFVTIIGDVIAFMVSNHPLFNNPEQR